MPPTLLPIISSSLQSVRVHEQQIGAGDLLHQRPGEPRAVGEIEHAPATDDDLQAQRVAGEGLGIERADGLGFEVERQLARREERPQREA
ncbi:MAG: hypothetical protein U1E52_09345 [Geminicoccaceae bacterium]